MKNALGYIIGGVLILLGGYANNVSNTLLGLYIWYQLDKDRQ